ncbi:MAG: rhodanese-like domain-containing protein [Hydrogenophaga sp.]|uniref:rhodanese-like domain-containing protein n=1 Tax=Hydrogenophaga sp. TaxID=1904254 RepID=UPI00275A3838|nr:rhodanese-like domain-containing protein [Hydrogenophaga sp.]MDP2418493.1 rhodanese-like domain-containing protein [Hydrogenophaga sp.]MDZ4187155.1 rhodanese-like domain-containing protein [Hydrogenophaga sp.]
MISIHPAQLKDWLASAAAHTAAGALPTVLDVREPWELQTASVKADGFTLLAMPMRSVPARYLELDRNQPIACLCHHGARSAQVVHFLMQNGFTEVVNIHGGIHAWSQELDATVPVY